VVVNSDYLYTGDKEIDVNGTYFQTTNWMMEEKDLVQNASITKTEPYLMVYLSTSRAGKMVMRESILYDLKTPSPTVFNFEPAWGC